MRSVPLSLYYLTHHPSNAAHYHFRLQLTTKITSYWIFFINSSQTFSAISNNIVSFIRQPILSASTSKFKAAIYSCITPKKKGNWSHHFRKAYLIARFDGLVFLQSKPLLLRDYLQQTEIYLSAFLRTTIFAWRFSRKLCCYRSIPFLLFTREVPARIYTVEKKKEVKS